jgi:Glycosyltransferase family 9 (heptosyltransferase)
MTITESERIYQEVYARDPALAMQPAGLAYMSFVRATEALEACKFRKALDLLLVADHLLPEDALPRWRCGFRYHRSIALLSLGDYVGGFREAEFRKVFFPHPGDALDLAEWRGENVMGKRLLIYQEMGFGDVIMMLRYVPLVKALGADITLMVATPLHPLLAQFGVKVTGELVEGADYDFRVPFFGLMPVLKQTVETIPDKPYLRWPEPYPLPPTNKPRIGIAWSGNPRHEKNEHRAIALDFFLALLDFVDAEFYSLQTDVPDEARANGVNVVEIKNFGDTQRVIAAMDHVVSVDTAPVHLAGALGHPSVHVVLPYAQDWRWFNGNAWYPNLRMYRQAVIGDWTLPFENVNRALRRHARREDRRLRRAG